METDTRITIDSVRPEIGAGRFPNKRTIPEDLVLTDPTRIAIECVHPEIGAGRFPIKRTVGEDVVVTADAFADGHDQLAVVLRYRFARLDAWHETPMQGLGNDRWRGQFTVTELGDYEYSVRAWIDRFATWRAELVAKMKAGHDVASELVDGAELVHDAADRASAKDGAWLRDRAEMLLHRPAVALDPELSEMMARYSDRSGKVSYDRILRVVVERERARYGAWYELFPRSCSREAGRHGTLEDLRARLPDIAAMGFDVLYVTPIHPIGTSFRKGPNNTLLGGPNDPGSPWAIGSNEGGHTAIHPALGSLDDFDRLVTAANQLHLEIALDIAFQCSPDHPYVTEHREWFRSRSDGSIKYAENPPKKYQDIYPINFECDTWQSLWQELGNVVQFWMEHGVRIFRVDNPHTKPFCFWEWLIREARKQDPKVVFLSEAFTRPKVMRYLAKCGFSQSYTYFTWRNTKSELTEYFTELTQSDAREYLRPNLFANTPDILHSYLQHGGPAAFQVRLVLAATLAASYGVYGPAFELCESRAVGGSEEYQDSEKYQLRYWDNEQAGHIRGLVARVNQIRRENPALRHNWNLRFYPVDNEQLLFYGKSTPDLANIVLVVVNLDPRNVQWGTVRVPTAELQLDESSPYEVHDLLSDARYAWHGQSNYVRLDPSVSPAHIFRVERRNGSKSSGGSFI
jgi:starch synthase (maltosyl-transferring)